MKNLKQANGLLLVVTEQCIDPSAFHIIVLGCQNLDSESECFRVLFFLFKTGYLLHMGFFVAVVIRFIFSIKKTCKLQTMQPIQT